MAIVTVAESVTNNLSHILEQLALPDLEDIAASITIFAQADMDTTPALSWRKRCCAYIAQTVQIVPR